MGATGAGGWQRTGELRQQQDCRQQDYDTSRYSGSHYRTVSTRAKRVVYGAIVATTQFCHQITYLANPLVSYPDFTVRSAPGVVMDQDYLP